MTPTDLLSALPRLIAGAGMTLLIVVVAVGGGVLFGLPLGVLSFLNPPSRLLRLLLWLFDKLFRGFPALVLLFLIYFGLGSLPAVTISPFAAVALALGLRSAAYQAQLFRSALGMVHRTQVEAARALGLSQPRTLIYILLPQALRFSLPGLANEYSAVLKDSALAFTVGVVELMSRGKFLSMATRDTTTTYLLVAAIYWLLTQLGISLFRLIEHHRRIPGLGSSRIAGSRGNGGG
ncbi:amino acid ABC transporter permease [Candidatus Bipolaricaulota bacterium]|nr:amino acid ABC transporter permease [Candidatus Bipolaricaulota bacterium]